MKPLNAYERRKAYFRFLLFYLLTLLVFMLIVYSGFRIPAIQNNLLKSQMESFEKQKQYNNIFSALLASVNDYEKTAQYNDQNDAKIKQAILGMQTYADNDSIEMKGFYTDVIRLITYVQGNNGQIRLQKAKVAYLQALMLQSNKLDEGIAEAQKSQAAQNAKQGAGGTAVKAGGGKDYTATLQLMLDSVIKYKLPAVESFNKYLCNGENTPVVVNNQGGHNFGQLYNEFKKHKKSSLLEVKTQTINKCITVINIKWKNNAFLGSNKLF